MLRFLETVRVEHDKLLGTFIWNLEELYPCPEGIEIIMEKELDFE
jgi:hypothetical protein